MKIKNEKDALQAFCSTDGLRPVLQKPWLIESRNEVWAADGRIILMVSKSLVRGRYKADTFGEKLEIPTERKCNTVFRLEDIDKAFNSLELTPEYVFVDGENIECPACDGSGNVEWEFTDHKGYTHYKDDECPVCDGFGYVGTRNRKETGRMIPPDDAMFRIDGAKFMVTTFMKAMEGLRLLGCTEVRHVYDSADHGNIFEVQDGILMLVMPAIGHGITKKVSTTKTGG